MKKALLFLIFAVAATPAFAEEVEVESKISAVTVFPDRADVSRNASVALTAGKHTLLFNDLPAGLITDSLRVAGKGSKAFVIGSVETKQIFTSELSVTEEKKLQEKIIALRDKRRLIEAETQAAETGQVFLRNLAQNAAAPTVKGEKREVSSPDTWQSAWQTIQKGMVTLGKEAVQKQIALREIDKEINALVNQQHQSATGRRSYKQVRVNVEIAQNTKADMVLQYQIMGAHWNPLYEARLDSSKETVKIIQYGNIAQRTGEDWSGVSLTLSTASPSINTMPPEIYTRWLDLRRNEPVQPMRRARVATYGAMEKSMSNFAMKEDMVMMDADMAMGGAAAPQAMMYEEASVDMAAVSGTEFSGVFVIKGISNVPSDGADYRFNIGDYANKAEIRAETIPAVDASAYLIATTIFNGELPLLPGNIALFRDDAFIGNSFMSLLRPNEKLHLSFGQDEKIRVKYVTLGEELSEGGVISRDSRKDASFRTEIQNLHKQPIKITVQDSLPVARNSDISVKIVRDKTTQGYTLNPKNKVGVIQWENVYQPQEKKTIDFGYTVSYPKDRILTGM